MKTFDNVCLGGTFDGLHAAHRILIVESILIARKRVLIGIASDELLKPKRSAWLTAPVSKRAQVLKEFCAVALYDFSNSVSNTSITMPIINPRVELPIINDVAGPAATEPDMQCIAVSADTTQNCPFINNLRKENGVPELEMHVVMVL